MIWLAEKFPRYRKFVVALAGVLAQVALLLQDLIGAGVIHGKALAAVQLGVALLTALGVRQTGNDDSSADDPTADGFDVGKIGGTPVGDLVEAGLTEVDDLTHGGLTHLVKQPGDDGYELGHAADRPSPHPHD